MESKSFFTQSKLILFTSFLGVLTGLYIDYALPLHSVLLMMAQSTSKIFINFLQLISLPIIFLSITATLTSMESFDDMKKLGKKTLKYTLITTIIAACVALIFFILIDPTRASLQLAQANPDGFKHNQSYLAFILDIIPVNIMQTLSDNSKVISVVFVASLLGFSTLSISHEHKKFLQSLFSSLFAAVLQITKIIIYILPIGVWAFTATFVKDLLHQDITSLLLYIACVILANIVQGVVVLPILLKLKGLSPMAVLRGMFKALTVAFFSKSSNATLPITLKCAQENLGISSRVANFTLPLCTVINMNGCAAFILITVLFIATKSGIVFSYFDMIAWIFIASLAAIGNAGVPMGCFFLTSAFLVGMNIPSHYLQILGIILPIYTFIDMIETTLNVWSDACVTAIVDKEVKSS